MCSKNEMSAILQKIAKTYRSVYGRDLVKVVVYGSYARGDFDEDSDLDIAAIVQGSRADLQEQLKQVWDITSELELKYGMILSPTVIPYKEFVQYKEDLPYYRNIVREGVDIVADYARK